MVVSAVEDETGGSTGGKAEGMIMKRLNVIFRVVNEDWLEVFLNQFPWKW